MKFQEDPVDTVTEIILLIIILLILATISIATLYNPETAIEFLEVIFSPLQ